LPGACDDGIVVDVAEHFEEVVSVRIAELAQSVDGRFDAVEARFAQVDARFDVVDARFDAVDARFEQVDSRFEQVDSRFDSVDARFDEVAEHFVEMRDFTTFCFDKLGSELRAEIADVKVGLGRVERRLDRHEELLGEVLREVRALKPK
jgi:archaellum component FlaC